MATDYNKIWESMEDGVEYTASQLGVAAASMTAMGKRKLVTVIDGKPKRYIKKYSVAPRIVRIVSQTNAEFFTLYKRDKKIGMLCSLKNGKIMDCWGNEYDTEDVVRLEVQHVSFRLDEDENARSHSNMDTRKENEG